MLTEVFPHNLKNDNVGVVNLTGWTTDFFGLQCSLFCGITGIINDYYGMATIYRLLNHNTLMTLYDY